MIMSIVQAWNQRNGKSRALFFNCLRWEDSVAPDIGVSGQDVISDQMGFDYDIFLGVMWARFGTPTVNAQSGTEEEFDLAFQRHKSGEQIRVSFLFCTADIPHAKLDGQQFAKAATSSGDIAGPDVVSAIRSIASRRLLFRNVFTASRSNCSRLSPDNNPASAASRASRRIAREIVG